MHTCTFGQTKNSKTVNEFSRQPFGKIPSEFLLTRQVQFTIMSFKTRGNFILSHERA